MNPQSSYPSPPTPYGPLQRRLLALAGFLSVLMIALIVFHALHTGSTGLNAVAEAAERTASQPGAKLAVEVTYTVESGSTGISKTLIGDGAGAYNAHTGRTSLNLTVPVPGQASISMESVGDARRVFLRSPMFAGELPPGREWLGMEPMLGHSSQTAFGSSGGTKSELDMLRAVGTDVEKLDQQTVRGHLTTRYKATVTLSHVAQLMSENGEASAAREYEELAERSPEPIPVEVWVDDHGLARQIRVVQKLPTTDDVSVTMDMRMQLYAFGSRPKIKLPSGHKVLDYTPVLRAELGLEDGSTLGPLTPPAGSKPLTTTAFRKQAGGICRAAASELAALKEVSAGLVGRIKAQGFEAAQSGGSRGLVAALASRFGEPAYRFMRRQIGKLAKVDPPTSDAADYRSYLNLEAKEAEWTLAQSRVFSLGVLKIPPGLATRKAEGKTEEGERERLAAKLGISICEKDVSDDGQAEAGPSAKTNVE